MDLEHISLHVMSLISKEMNEGTELVEACNRVHDHIRRTTPSMIPSVTRNMIDQALNLMVDLGRINARPDWLRQTDM